MKNIMLQNACSWITAHLFVSSLVLAILLALSLMMTFKAFKRKSNAKKINSIKEEDVVQQWLGGEAFVHFLHEQNVGDNPKPFA